MASSRKELDKLMTSRNVKRRRRRRVKIVALLCAVVLCAGIAVGGANLYIIRGAAGHILTPGQAIEHSDFDAILVLGASIQPAGPSAMLEDRLIAGIALYNAGAAPVILMSGGPYEVEIMRRYAIDNGVPEESILMDDQGLRTHESLLRARDVFEARRLLIVTQRFHVYRAIYSARQLGIAGYGVTSDRRTYTNQLSNDAREALARVRAVVDGVIN